MDLAIPLKEKKKPAPRKLKVVSEKKALEELNAPPPQPKKVVPKETKPPEPKKPISGSVNVIVKLPITEIENKDLDKIFSSGETFKYTPELSNPEPFGDNTQFSEIDYAPTPSKPAETAEKELWPSKVDTHCWWCCHQFSGSPIPIPTDIFVGERIKRFFPDFKFKDSETFVYNDNMIYNEKMKLIFKVTGTFCSYPCALAYAVKEQKDIPLLKFMHFKLTGKPFNYRESLPKETLKMFGGTLDITDYRDQEQEITLYQLPLIPSNHYIHVKKKNQLVKPETKVKGNTKSIEDLLNVKLV